MMLRYLRVSPLVIRGDVVPGIDDLLIQPRDAC